MIVVLGLPSSSITINRGEMDSTLTRLSEARDDNKKPYSPTEEFLEFFVADDVTNW